MENKNQNQNQPKIKVKTKICKYCKSEIPEKAKICPKCRKKQKKPMLLIIIIFILLFALVGGDEEKSSNVSSSNSTKTEIAPSKENNFEKEADQKVIEYISYNVDDMMDILSSNALKAEKEFSEKYVEITGRLAVIDSDGDYISLHPINDEWAIMGVQCQIENDEQLNRVLDMSIGDTVTLKGKITMVGEVLGYILDIDEIK